MEEQALHARAVHSEVSNFFLNRLLLLQKSFILMTVFDALDALDGGKPSHCDHELRFNLTVLFTPPIYIEQLLCISALLTGA